MDEERIDNPDTLPEESGELIPEKPKKKLKKWLVVLICIVLFFTLLIAGGWIALKIMVPYNYNPITKDPEELGISQEVVEKSKEEKIVNIALFGIDTRDPESFKGRSDSIMILSINTKTGDIKLISVMRDSFVPIDKESGRVYSKINSAYASGGPVLAIKTLNTIFNLDISEYVSVNMFKLKDIIDAVGGIEYLKKLSVSVPTTQHVKYYSNIPPKPLF